ncbi:MAG: hypothetical protein HYX94_00500 [Chloroflexi bacterium]|nr:hypothetical protein [Chloroflexota bacterium]
MKIPNDVLSEIDGQIEEILCEDGQAVEYGQSLNPGNARLLKP